ncbi:hypothetical protein [Actinomadura rudentiformis]|uniref:DUF308 domain-containing protein n=1 Tax=Actinomadura rudentiformis TaxID=359158 RepID=A0A6H9YC42_9ACTN|nr:hypothetical protein [Actinomadura rudentiformis]KAB2342956.1 hypothetical protein F8566_35940 [Actinomadura rudentiformis]
MNRRGNGLSADTYAPLVDLAPHLADAMLTALREAGVAAYAAAPDGLAELVEPVEDPAAGDVLDRLYVDVDMKPTAEGILRAHLTRLRDARGADSDLLDDRPDDHLDAEPRGSGDPRAPHGTADTDGADKADRPAAGHPADASADTPPSTPAERDEEAIWAEIVAGFDTAHEGDRVPWPDQENLQDEPEPADEGDDRTGRLPRARVIKSADGEEEFPEADDDGHYVPPPPPPLPSTDPLTKGAWIALIGGPVYLLITVVLNWEVPGWAAFLAVAAFIGGFVTLVLRMGDEPRDPDDGAVV